MFRGRWLGVVVNPALVFQSEEVEIPAESFGFSFPVSQVCSDLPALVVPVGAASRDRSTEAPSNPKSTPIPRLCLFVAVPPPSCLQCHSALPNAEGMKRQRQRTMNGWRSSI